MSSVNKEVAGSKKQVNFQNIKNIPACYIVSLLKGNE